MKTNMETILHYSSQMRKYYAHELNKRLKDYHLSPNEISILMMLSNNKTITTSRQLVVLLGVSKGLVSRSVDLLCQKNLVACYQDVHDRRVQHLYLTESSCDTILRIEQEIQKIDQELLSDIPIEKIQNMHETMMEIISRFPVEDIKRSDDL